MTTRRLLASCALMAAAACVPFRSIGAESVATPAKAEAEAVSFSEAETRMWMTDQLKTVTRPMDLVYDFEHGGSYEDGFKDRVVLKITRVNPDGSKALDLDFFTGSRHQQAAPVASATVNLVLSRFMEGDIHEMNRLTDSNGSASERWRYFQRRIKLALAETAEVAPTTFEFDGRGWKGHEIRFAPYLNDPHREEFKSFATKRYSVIVSDELPGYLYRIETVIPGENGAQVPLIREVLQLRSAKPAT